MSPIVYVVLVLYLAAVLYIGYWTSKSTTLSDYYAAGRKMPYWVVGSAYIATFMSGASFLGLVGSVYANGFFANGAYVGSVLGYMAGLAFFGPLLRRFGQFTIPDFLGSRFDSNTVRFLSGLLIFLGYFLYISTQVIGVGILFQMLFGIPYWLAASFALLVVLVYTILGGMMATAYVDVFQMIFMWLSAVIIVTVGVVKGGGVMSITESVRTQFPNFLTADNGSGDIWPIVALILVWVFGTLSRADTISRAYLAKSEREVYKAILFTTPFIWACGMLFFFFGFIGKGTIPGLEGTQAENLFLLMAMDWVPPVITGMAFAGILATAQSTVSGQMMTASMAVGRDIYGFIISPMLKNRPATEQEILKVTKYSMVFMGIISLIFAIMRPTWILDIVNISMAIMGPAFLVTWLGGFFWKKATKTGAICALLLGGIGGITTSFITLVIPGAPWLVEPLFNVILATLGLVVGSKFGKPSEKSLQVFEMLRTPRKVADSSGTADSTADVGR